VADVADVAGGVWGEVQLPGGGPVICWLLAFRLIDGRDWLDLSIPMGALEDDSDRGIWEYSSEWYGDPESLAWWRAIDAWFAGLAAQVRQVTGFKQALIGPEVSDEAGDPAAHSRAGRPNGIVLADGTYLPAGG
jgi:hypothetical protein